MSNLISSRKKNKALQLLFTAVAILLLLVQALPQTAENRQATRQTVGNKQAVARVAPNLYRVNKRPEIPFKPLEMVEPRTGKPVMPTTLLRLEDRNMRENGKTITAAKYYEQMNRLEAEYNKLGYTVRGSEKKHKINETLIDRARIATQARNPHTIAPNPRTSARLESIAQAHRAYIKTVRSSFGTPNGWHGFIAGTSTAVPPGLFARTLSITRPTRPSMPIVIPGSSSTVAPPKIRPGLRIGSFSKGPDNQAIFGDPRTDTLTASPSVTFYVHKIDGQPLAKKYAWQVVRANARGDNFGTEMTTQYNDVGPGGWKTWKSVDGAVSGTTTLTAQSGGDPNFPYFFIDFSAFAKGIPAGESWAYLVRVIPMNDDGSLAGYPSFPMRVTYGQNPKPTPINIPMPPPRPIRQASDQTVPWTYTIGDPGIVSIDLAESLQNHQTQLNQQTAFSFNASATLLGIRETFIDVCAHANSTADTPSAPSQTDGGVFVKLLGIDVLGSDCSASTGLPIDKDFHKAIDVSIPVAFNLGPIDVSASGGFSGTLSIGAALSAGGGEVDFTFGPSLKATVFLELAVGIGIGGFDVVQAGVEGSLDLIDFGVVIGFHGPELLGTATPADPYHWGPAGYYGKISQFSTLSGALSAFVKVGICPFCDEWDWEICNFPGYDILGGDPNKGLLFEGSL